MTPSLPEHAAAREIPTSFYDPQRSPRSSPPTMNQLLSQFVRPSLPHLADGEPGSSPDNLIDLDDRPDEEHDTEFLSEDRESSPLGGDAERECDSETGDGRSREATSIRDLEGEPQTQPQSGSQSTESPQPVSEPEPKAVIACECLSCVDSDKENVEPLPPQFISGALPNNISEDGPSKETHVRVGDSFTPHLEPDTSSPHILLHCEAREEHLEFLLWAPIWQSEDEIAKVHPDQLKRYKKRLSIRPVRRASQARNCSDFLHKQLVNTEELCQLLKNACHTRKDYIITF
ncbi:predicted protein [Histoplasma mississippiense (nom. inval.)]|uniref:predicted protein n=1 Tax=Ajellomyces capsulatus (strain NAm1 / WU24) TaxID=2059318 RepID=UPI000157C837|nr:predicted protein [Histoplasma mississippiense (nom. inval.)]EDN09838.1 predicted protein [Histoplasma mississippiense (nom. inval.)]